MALSPGARLGPYEILAPLGAGGMGEVYRARDTRLNRDVAVKVLPGDFLEGEERRARFEREAKLLAALNHPNIAAVFSFEEISSSPSLSSSSPASSRHVLVMELLEGESLLSRLAEGPLAPRRATELAVQLAEGLAAAHDKGIVHRDLKPGNLWITKEGRLKILDFGLARKAPGLQAKADTALPTADATPGRPTSEGVILGTLGYMSPEQVRGEAVDARSDIFSLGVVLFEMLTGKRAFERKTAADTLAAILKEDPPEPDETGRQIPPGLRRIVDRCLEKSPARRFQSAQDLAFALEATQGVTSQTAARDAAVPASGRFLRGVLTAAAAAVLLGLAFLAGWKAKPGASQPRYTQVTHLADPVGRARFTRDGRSVAFEAGVEEASRIYVQAIGDPISRSVLERNAFLASASRSDELAVLLPPWDWGRTLGICPAGGAAPRFVSKNVWDAEWSPDGTSLCVIRREKNGCRIEYPEGKTLLRIEEGVFSHPRFSPDGRHLAVFKHPAPGLTDGLVQILDLATGRTRDLTGAWADLSGLAWSPHAREVWFSGAREGMRSELFAADLRGTVRRVFGAPTRLRLEDVAPDGRALVARADYRLEAFVHDVAAGSKRRLSRSSMVYGLDLSRDGRLAILSEQATAALNATLWVTPTDGALPVKLCEGETGEFSPDGNHVLVLRMGPKDRVYAVVPTAGGPEAVLRTDGLSVLDVSFWNPRIEVLGLATRGDEAPRAWRLASDSPPAPVGPPLPGGAFGLQVPDPRGRLALVSLRDRSQIWVDLDDPAGKPRLAANWDPEERRSRSADGVWCYTLRKGENGAPHRLGRRNLHAGSHELLRTVDLHGIGSRLLGPAVVSDDGSKILFSVERVTSDLFVVEGLK